MRDGSAGRSPRVQMLPDVPAPERGLEPLTERDFESLAMRPRTRAECGTERPCPWVGCEHHLAINELVCVTPGSARIRWMRPDLDVWEMSHTCLLDLIDQHGGGMSLGAIAEIYGVTRERVRQIEAKGMRKVRNTARLRRMDRTIIEDLQEFDGCRPGLSPLAQAAETEGGALRCLTAEETLRMRRAVAAIDPIARPAPRIAEPAPRPRPERPAEPEARPSAPQATAPVLEPSRRHRRLWTREQRREVESWLWITSSRNDPQTTTELATLGDLSPAAAGCLLRRLEREGRVERVGRRWRMHLEEVDRG